MASDMAATCHKTADILWIKGKNKTENELTISCNNIFSENYWKLKGMNFEDSDGGDYSWCKYIQNNMLPTLRTKVVCMLQTDF